MNVFLARSELLAAILVAAACVALFPNSVAAEPRVCHAQGLASRKDAETPLPPPLLGTLVQTHTEERVLLDESSPAPSRFDALLADHATGSSAPLDPRLLELLREVAWRFRPLGGGPSDAPAVVRVELVSGFRSPKLNEMLRKKGHHVASHSQHSLGHAVDFRIVVHPRGERDTDVALDPRVIERAIRETGWEGGTGIYTLRDDWFVHADVGPNRTWFEGPRGAETTGLERPRGP